MTPEEQLEALRNGMAAIIATPSEHLDRDVPPCPGWTVHSVIAHTGAVHRWAVGALVGEKVPFTDEDAPKGQDVIGWYADYADKLVATLESMDLDAPTKSPFGERPVRFWYRRQAQEVAVHRWDIQSGYLGFGADPVDAALAADGIGEWSEIFAPKRLRGGTPEDLRGTRILLNANDSHGSWLLQVDADSIDIVREDATPEATIEATTSDLLLALWRRVPLSRVTVTGDADLARRVFDLVKI